MVTVQNFNHDALREAAHNKTLSESLVKSLKSDAGDFDFYSATNGTSLLDIGLKGWELVSAVPQIETETETGGAPNTRTGQIILIFKRPMP